MGGPSASFRTCCGCVFRCCCWRRCATMRSAGNTRANIQETARCTSSVPAAVVSSRGLGPLKLPLAILPRKPSDFSDQLDRHSITSPFQILQNGQNQIYEARLLCRQQDTRYAHNGYTPAFGNTGPFFRQSIEICIRLPQPRESLQPRPGRERVRVRKRKEPKREKFLGLAATPARGLADCSAPGRPEPSRSSS